ncbi:DNA-3-methyladenine glycosylase family protein [Burkholderia sp. KBS0801]|uniref:DNA-3-methyladenine glycosylase family protein n=1 Tax=Burkholderia sp. KBS0801 TaxID=1179675 RepID=UPI00110E37E8|nr:AlkA N-terminal domain-containing protein [Burkholderia sp. KBS0801]QDW51881.1 DNA-3-methyladenine glycosylase 2 family protein [Burkholderia sp. KBS0801]
MSIETTTITSIADGGQVPPSAQMELRFKAPYDWARVLRFFSGRAIPGVEQVVDGVYRRIVDLNGDAGRLTVTKHPRRHCLIATVEGAAARHVDDAFSRRVASMFDLGADPAAIGGGLARDPWFAPLVAAAPGLRVPGAWSGFELAVRAIVGQQVSVKAATTIVGRLVQRAGERVVHDDGMPAPDGAPAWRFPTPDALAACDLEKIGMPGKRAAALTGMARAVAAGHVPLDPAQADLGTLRRAWLDLPGIGPWTVEYIAMRAWRDPDAWPASDLVLMQSITARDPSLDRLASQKHRTEGWRPWRAYAALHLWNDVADRASGARGG